MMQEYGLSQSAFFLQRAANTANLNMKTSLVALMLLFLVKDSTGSPVRPSTVEDRVQQLEVAEELRYEFTNDFGTRLAVLERLVAGLLGGTKSDTQFPNGTLNEADFKSLQERLNQQPSLRTNDTMPVLNRNVAPRALPGTQVAFHAYAGSNRVFTPNEVIVFDTTVTNYGSGYTSSDGIFDAPASGVYVLTWTISTSKFHLPFITHLIINGDVRGILTSDSDYAPSTSTGHGNHPATGVVVATVQTGDHIFIRLINPEGTTSTLQSDVIERSTFSGWLLF